FDPATVERLLGHYGTLLAAAAADPLRRISELPLLDASERWQLLGEWQDQGPSPATEPCLHQLFEEQAARTPAAVAVVDAAGRRLTYRELDRWVEALEARLRPAGDGP